MQITFKTGKGELLFVKVPEGANCFTIQHNRLCFNDCDNMPDYVVLNKYGLSPEQGQEDEEFWDLAVKWQEEQNRINSFNLIGRASQITEEQAKELVDEFHTWGRFAGYVNYCDEVTEESQKGTALDSLKSILQHLKIYSVNPYHDPTKDLSFYDNEDGYKKCLDIYEQAQERTFDPIVLFKPNNCF